MVLFHSLSVSFYHSPRIFVPLLLISMFSLIWKSNKTYSKEFKRTGLLYGIAVFFVSFLLIFVVKGGTGRFNQVNIFGSPETRLVMEEQLREDGSRSVPLLVAEYSIIRLSIIPLRLLQIILIILQVNICL